MALQFTRCSSVKRLTLANRKTAVRTAFIEQLILEARSNPALFLVVGDLGYSVVEPFADQFPDRFLNAGVAEQNMTGVAAGLASEGYHVFTYSIANFPMLRCLEQIRNDVCYHSLAVTIVAVGGGLAYGNLGYSHHALQDIAITRTLPNMTVLAPADPGEVRECVNWLSAHPGPSYLRIGKAGEPLLHAVRGIEKGPLAIRAAASKIALVTTGGILDEALLAADALETLSCPVAVYSLPWLKPLTTEFVGVLRKYNEIIAIEEHLPEGGLASALRQYLPNSVSVRSMAVSDSIVGKVGRQNYLRRESLLNSENIISVCRGLIN